MQYVSWKEGDPAIKADPQVINPKTWTLLHFGANGELINPTVNGLAHLGTYFNVSNTGGAKTIQVRYIRDPKGAADFTGSTSFSFTAGHIFSHMWAVIAKKGTPLGVQVWHDGPKPLTISTREFKAAIVQPLLALRATQTDETPTSSSNTRSRGLFVFTGYFYLVGAGRNNQHLCTQHVEF